MGLIRDILLILEGMLIYRTIYEFLRMQNELKRARRRDRDL